MSMMIAAADLGIGTGHAAIEDQDLAHSLLGFPEDSFAAYLFSLITTGHSQPLHRPNRGPFDQVVHHNHW